MKQAIIEVAKEKEDYQKKLRDIGFEAVLPEDLNITSTVKETTCPIKSATLKADEYLNKTGLISVVFDDGIYFNDIPEDKQPGTSMKIDNILKEYPQDTRGYILKVVSIVTEEAIFSLSFKVKLTLQDVRKKDIYMEEEKKDEDELFKFVIQTLSNL